MQVATRNRSEFCAEHSILVLNFPRVWDVWVQNLAHDLFYTTTFSITTSYCPPRRQKKTQPNNNKNTPGPMGQCLDFCSKCPCMVLQSEKNYSQFNIHLLLCFQEGKLFCLLTTRGTVLIKKKYICPNVYWLKWSLQHGFMKVFV